MRIDKAEKGVWHFGICIDPTGCDILFFKWQYSFNWTYTWIGKFLSKTL